MEKVFKKIRKEEKKEWTQSTELDVPKIFKEKLEDRIWCKVCNTKLVNDRARVRHQGCK